jgi:hypothetical protein
MLDALSQDAAVIAATAPSRATRLKTWAPSLAAAAVIALSFILRIQDLPGFTVCWFKAATGWPCPGCGLTRAFCAISHGDFATAWHHNPFSFAFYAGFLAALFWPALRRSRHIAALARRLAVSRWLAVAVVLVLWAWAIGRILCQ